MSQPWSRSDLPRLPLSALFPPPPSDGVRGDPGVTPPLGPFWSITGERAMALGGPAAILLQVAHPLVAEGVSVHSEYQAGPAKRLLGTLQAFLTITFGDTEQARAVARHVGGRHAQVRGETRGDVPGTPAGTTYRAADPHLALWVHATLIHTALDVADRYLGRPLSPADRERHWQESKPFARMFGVTRSALPGSADDFEAYWRRSVDDLVVTDDARTIARDLLTVRTSPPLPGVAALARSVTADLLPPSVSAAYGLDRTVGRRVTATAARTLLRTARPVLPDRIAQWPHVRVGTRRLHV